LRNLNRNCLIEHTISLGCVVVIEEDETVLMFYRKLVSRGKKEGIEMK
jgi:hypothetical protein